MILSILLLLAGSGMSLDLNTMLTVAGSLITVGTLYQTVRDSKARISELKENIATNYVRKEDYNSLKRSFDELKENQTKIEKRQEDTQTAINELKIFAAETNLNVKLLLEKIKP